MRPAGIDAIEPLGSLDQLASSFTLGKDAVGTVAADCYVLGMHLADLLMEATGGDLAAAEAPLEGSPDSVGGVLLRAKVDPDHWLAAGEPR